MNITQYCKWATKDEVYDAYSNVIRYPRAYESISRKKMCEEVLKQLQKTSLENIITYNEYDALFHLADGQHRTQDIDLYRSLTSRLLVVYDLESQKYVILDEFKDTIKSMLSCTNLDILKKRKMKDMIIAGAIKAHGMISPKHLRSYLTKYVLDNCSFSDFRKVDYYLQFYDLALFEAAGLIMDKRFILYREEMMEAYKEYDDVMENKNLLSLKSLDSIFKHNFDLSIKSVKTLYEQLNKLDSFYVHDLIEKILLYNHIQVIIDSHFFPRIAYLESEFESINKLMDKALKYIPSANFHGYSEAQFKKEFEFVDKTGNACLSIEDAALFYKLYFGLLEYTNKKYHIEPKLKRFYGQNSIDPALVFPIREYLFKHRHIISKFIRKNPYHFDKDELEIVRGFEYALQDIFSIMKHDNEYAYLLGVNGNFAVKGLFDPLIDVIPKGQLPFTCPMILLPFKEHIIYDGIIASYPIQVSPAQVRMLKNEFEKNTTYYLIDTKNTNTN